MRFINPWLLALLLVLSACSSGPKKPAVDEAGQGASEAGASALLPPGPPTPNPYLASKPSISRQPQQSFNDELAAMAPRQWSHAQTLRIWPTAEKPGRSGAFLNLGLVYRATG